MADVNLEPLDYATPSENHKRNHPFLAIFFGALSGLIGIVASFYGIEGIVWLIQDWETIDARDVLAVVCFTLIGAVCLFICIRWIRNAIRDALDPWAG